MLKTLILLFIYVSQSDGNKTKVGGGYPCSGTAYSYVVAIIHGTGDSFHFVGGGTLLSKNWVLTAAVHLYDINNASNFTVIAGISNLSEFKSKGKNVQSSSVQAYYRSIDLQTDSLDIALLKLEKSILKSRTVSYVRLANARDIGGKKLENICHNATIIGFGEQISDVEIPEKLYCGQIPVISEIECSRMLPYFNLPDQLGCIYRENLNVCHGDSGGPIMCNGIQYGVMTAGYGCTDPIPTLYAKVHKYQKFITSYMNTFREDRKSKCSSNNFLHFFVLIFFLILICIFD